MGGISAGTAKGLRQDPDLDKSLYDTPVAPPVLSNTLRGGPPTAPTKFYTPAGKTPLQIQQEQEAAMQKYLLYKQGKFRR